MNVNAGQHQTKLLIWSITAKLHFGSDSILLPTIETAAVDFHAAAEHMAKRSGWIAEKTQGARLEVLAIERGPVTYARSSTEPDPITVLGNMMARALIEWLQK